MKIVSRRNPVKFLNNIFANFESVPKTYIVVDETTGEVYHRTPKLEKTGQILESLNEDELIYDSKTQLIRLKTEEEVIYCNNVVTNNSFKGKRYKVTVLDLGKFIKTPYQPYIAYCKERSSIVTESITTVEGINQLTQVVAYMDYIFGEEMEFDSEEFYESDLAMISYANYADGERIFNLEYNPVWDLFNPTTS